MALGLTGRCLRRIWRKHEYMKTGRADLHVHTTASDGVLTPAQVVEEAARVGLSAIGISDHDTVAGLEEGMAAGKRLGVEVIPAIELSTDHGLFEIHILGYFFDWHSEKLLETLRMLRDARRERGMKMVEKLNELGVPVTFDRVMEIAGTGSVGRPHVARAIVETGVVTNMNGAFGRYLVKGAPAYIERTMMTPFDAVRVITCAGGVASFAHPSKVNYDNIIPELIKAGLGGIEAFHSDHSANVRRKYHAIARRNGIIATGGSDAHGFDPDARNTIGSVTVPMGIVEELREAAERQSQVASNS